MRWSFFGDSYDIVKRALLQWLLPLGHRYVQPLFTDDVSEEQAAIFADFLGASLVRPFHARTRKERDAAVEACRGVGNVFLDPDTGVILAAPGRSVKTTHLSAEVLRSLCAAAPGCIVVSFDQALRRGAPEDSLRSKVLWLKEHRITAVVFRSHASFLFCSTNSDRVGDVARALTDAGLPDWRVVKVRTPS